MSGWIKLHRELLEWEWYDHAPTKTILIHLLLKANHKLSRYRGHDVPTGALVCGVNKLSEQTGLTISQVRTAIKNLKETGEIAIKVTNKFSIISMVKWSKYQSNDTQIANKPQTDSKQIATSKEYNNTTTVVRAREKISEIVGWKNDPSWFGDFSRMDQWAADGWDIDLDILPTISRLMAKKTGPPPKTLKYFEQAIADACAARLTPLPKGKNYETTNKPTATERNQAAKRQALAELGVEEAGC